MRFSTFFLFILFIVIGNAAFAQFDLSEIMLTATDSSRFIISNGRNRILKNIEAGQGEKNIELLKSLNAIIDQNQYITLFVDEEQLVSFLTGNKDFFLNSLKEKDWILNREFPPSDNLYDNCYAVLTDSINFWKTRIANMELNDEEKMLYELYLSQLGLGLKKPVARALAKKYCKTYALSDFIPFANSLKPDFNTSSMGYAVGGGNIYLSESTASYVDVGGLLSFDMDYFLNKFYFSFYMLASLKGNSLLALEGVDEFDDLQFYDAGNHATHFSFGTKLGWALYKNKWLKLYPYGCLSIANLSVSHANSDVDNLSLTTGFGMGAGIGADITLFSWTASSIEDDAMIDHHIGLRFNAALETIFAGKNYIDYSDWSFYAGVVWWMGD